MISFNSDVKDKLNRKMEDNSRKIKEISCKFITDDLVKKTIREKVINCCSGGNVMVDISFRLREYFDNYNIIISNEPPHTKLNDYEMNLVRQNLDNFDDIMCTRIDNIVGSICPVHHSTKRNFSIAPTYKVYHVTLSQPSSSPFTREIFSMLDANLNKLKQMTYKIASDKEIAENIKKCTDTSPITNRLLTSSLTIHIDNLLHHKIEKIFNDNEMKFINDNRDMFESLMCGRIKSIFKEPNVNVIPSGYSSFTIKN